MSKNKKRAAAKSGTVWHQSAEEATLAAKPHFNGFACGHGAHGDVKYNRCKEARAWKQRMDQEGASRGSFLIWKIHNRTAQPTAPQPAQKRNEQGVPYTETVLPLV